MLGIKLVLKVLLLYDDGAGDGRVHGVLWLFFLARGERVGPDLRVERLRFDGLCCLVAFDELHCPFGLG